MPLHIPLFECNMTSLTNEVHELVRQRKVVESDANVQKCVRVQNVDRIDRKIQMLQREIERQQQAPVPMVIAPDDSIKPSKDNLVDYYRCKICKTMMNVIAHQSMACCPKCSWSRVLIDSHVILQFSSEVLHEPCSSYSREDHFKGIIKEILPMEEVDIPKEVVDKVRRFLRRDRIGPTRYITPTQTDDFMKELGLKEYYKYSLQLTLLINNTVNPPCLDVASGDLLCSIVEEINMANQQIQNSSLAIERGLQRKSTLSCNLKRYYALMLMGKENIANRLKTLTGVQTLRSQMTILRVIAIMNRWPFAMMVGE